MRRGLITLPCCRFPRTAILVYRSVQFRSVHRITQAEQTICQPNFENRRGDEHQRFRSSPSRSFLSGRWFSARLSRTFHVSCEWINSAGIPPVWGFCWCVMAWQSYLVVRRLAYAASGVARCSRGVRGGSRRSAGALRMKAVIALGRAEPLCLDRELPGVPWAEP